MEAIHVAHRDPRTRASVIDALRARGYIALAHSATLPQSVCAALVVVDASQLPVRCGARVLALADCAQAAGAAFAAGADDVLCDPQRTAELVARVAALLRASAHRVSVGALVLEPRSRSVELDGGLLLLSRREYDLLARLATRPGCVFTKAELLRDIWGAPPRLLASTRTLDAHVTRLRRKLGAHAHLLVTAWGVGYRLG